MKQPHNRSLDSRVYRLESDKKKKLYTCMPASSMVYYLYNMGRFIYFFDLIVYVLAAQTSASQAGPKFKIVRQEV